jgi:hypothetical protein
MDRATGLAALNTVIAERLASRSVIARNNGVHPSQISRIAAGHFKRLDGHALKVCKYAQKLLVRHRMGGDAQVEVLGRKMMELVSTQPEVATALNVMLDAMLSQASGETPADAQTSA